MTKEKTSPEIDSKHQMLKYQIWITSKSRTQSEKICKLLDKLMHIVLILLSILVIALGIFGDKFFSPQNVDNLSILFSVGVLAFSIFVSGFRFGEKAILFRECYLKLDELEGSNLEYWDMRRRYHDILAAFPNHSTFDYNYFIYNHRYVQKRSIDHPRNQEVSLGYLTRAKMFIFRNIYLFLSATIIPIFFFWSA